jgi:formylglycine-generating enzyme required for sulfatase activity
MTRFKATFAGAPEPEVWRLRLRVTGRAWPVLVLTGVLVLWPFTNSPAQEAPPPAGAPEGFQPYVETIPGTLVKFEMIPIRGGTFPMADPAPPGATREVEVKPFWIGKTEVTWDAYDVYFLRLDLTEEQRKAGVDARSRPSKPYGAPDRGFGHRNYPMLGLSYYAAQQYCEWLSARTGKKYRLPTEAEWEYAGRAGATEAGPMDQAALDKVAWFWENADDQTHAVAQKQPNAWGLYDLLGNVAEWCLKENEDQVPVVRGGSYNDRAEKVYCGARMPEIPDWDASDPQRPKGKWWLSDAPFVGFRVVCEGPGEG